MKQLKKLSPFFILILVLLLATTLSADSTLVINEVMSANDTTIRDEESDESDWLEIFNTGDSPIHLDGYGLSDDPAYPFKWRFPAVSLESQQFLIVYASDKNRSHPLTPLHANFKLKSSGETLVLTAPDGQLVDRIEVPKLHSDQSFGRLPDGSATWTLLSSATPGASNQSENTKPKTAPPLFSSAPGFYHRYSSIALTANDPNATIFYTLDGREPDSSATPYNTPIILDTTVVVRARVFSPSALPSDIVTSTFFVEESFSFPVVSLTTDPDNLWDEHDGIYVKGANARSEYPYKGANFWREWERPIHVEFFEKNQSLAFSQNAGIRIFGHSSVAAPFKPLAIYAREKYGAGKFFYQLFPEKDIHEFEAFMLRNSGNDWNRTLFRDALMHRLAGEIGLPTQAYRPVIVFLNGVYWGIHNLRERMNEHYIAANFGIEAENVDLVAWNYGFQVYAGDAANYTALRDFVRNNDLTVTENYNQLADLMDIDNYIDYFATEIYCNNRDWPGNNQYMWRSRRPGGRWMWLIKDMDHGFGYESPATNNTLFRNALKDELFAKLLENSTFRNRFINRFAFLMNTTFQPKHVKSIISDMQAILAPEIPRHVTRWAGVEEYGRPPETFAEWLAYCDVLYDFADNRIANVQQHLKDHFNLGEMATVTLNVNSTEQGRLLLENHIITSYPWTGQFFPNIPFAVRAEAKTGYRFVGWDGLEITSDSVSVCCSGDVELIANFQPLSSTGLTVVINEINYNSAGYFDVKDWIELINTTDVTLNLSNWLLKDAEDKHSFRIPMGTMLAPNGFLILAREINTFRAYFPRLWNAVGDFDFGLSSQGDAVRLYDNLGTLIDSVSYKSTLPWPGCANSRGATLALVLPTADNTKPLNWFAASPPGTPGAPNIQREPICITNLHIFTNEKSNVLEWKTNQPNLGHIFQVQKQRENNWITVGFKDDIAIEDEITYRFPISFENMTNEAASYRIEYLDQHGDLTYSETIQTTIQETATPEFHFSNYPNPFNGSTTFTVHLAHGQFVAIDVFNLQGQHVEKLVADNFAMGEHNIVWRALDQPSGLYFCRVTLGQRTFFQKITLQK